MIEVQRAVASAESHGGRIQRADARRCLAHSPADVHDAGNAAGNGQTGGADPAAIMDRQRAVAGVTHIEAVRVDPLRSGAADCHPANAAARAIGANTAHGIRHNTAIGDVHRAFAAVTHREVARVLPPRSGAADGHPASSGGGGAARVANRGNGTQHNAATSDVQPAGAEATYREAASDGPLRSDAAYPHRAIAAGIAANIALGTRHQAATADLKRAAANVTHIEAVRCLPLRSVAAHRHFAGAAGIVANPAHGILHNTAIGDVQPAVANVTHIEAARVVPMRSGAAYRHPAIAAGIVANIALGIRHHAAIDDLKRAAAADIEAGGVEFVDHLKRSASNGRRAGKIPGVGKQLKHTGVGLQQRARSGQSTLILAIGGMVEVHGAGRADSDIAVEAPGRAGQHALIHPPSGGAVSRLGQLAGALLDHLAAAVDPAGEGSVYRLDEHRLAVTDQVAANAVGVALQPSGVDERIAGIGVGPAQVPAFRRLPSPGCPRPKPGR